MFYVLLPSKNGMLERKVLRNPLVKDGLGEGLMSLAIASARKPRTLTSELSTPQTCGTEFKYFSSLKFSKVVK